MSLELENYMRNMLTYIAEFTLTILIFVGFYALWIATP